MKIGERARDTSVANFGKRVMCNVHVFCKKSKMKEIGAISGKQHFCYSIFRKLVVAFLTKRLYDKNVHAHRTILLRLPNKKEGFLKGGAKCYILELILVLQQ